MSAEKKQRTYGGASAEERTKQRFDKLMAAALDIIGTEGYSAATVRAVCKKAGLTQRYYYETFEDSESMLIRVYNHQLDLIEKAMVSAAMTGAGQPLDKVIEKVLNAFFKTIEEDPRLGRIVLYEVLGVSAQVDSVYRVGTQRFVNLVNRIMIPMLGEIPKNVDPEILTRAIVGGAVQVATHWMLTGFKVPRRRLVRSLLFGLESLQERPPV